MQVRYDFGNVDIHKRKTLPHWDAEFGAQSITVNLLDDRRFTRLGAAIVAETILFDDQRRYQLFAWCVMPTHLHVLLRPKTTLAEIVQTLKSISAKRLGGGKWWQQDYFDTLMRDAQQFENTVRYIMNNPETAELTDWNFRGMYPDRMADYL